MVFFLQVLDLLVNILNCPIEARDAKEGWLNIFKVIFEIFQSYLMGNSRKNKQYFMKYVEFCQTKFIAQVIYVIMDATQFFDS